MLKNGPQFHTPKPTRLSVMPMEDNDNADTVKTEAEVVAALDEAEKSQDWKIAVLKAKINCFRCNNQSSRPPTPGPSTSAPRPPKKAPKRLPRTWTAATVDEKATTNSTAMTAATPELPWLVPMASRTLNVHPLPSTPTLKFMPTPPPCSPPLHHLLLDRARSYTIQTHTLIQI